MLSGHTRSGLSSFCLSADVDECAVMGACGPDRVCMNTVGSFRCECRPGYHTTSLGRHCRGALPHQTKFCSCFPVLTLSMCLFVLGVCTFYQILTNAWGQIHVLGESVWTCLVPTHVCVLRVSDWMTTRLTARVSHLTIPFSIPLNWHHQTSVAFYADVIVAFFITCVWCIWLQMWTSVWSPVSVPTVTVLTVKVPFSVNVKLASPPAQRKQPVLVNTQTHTHLHTLMTPLVMLPPHVPFTSVIADVLGMTSQPSCQDSSDKVRRAHKWNITMAVSARLEDMVQHAGKEFTESDLDFLGFSFISFFRFVRTELQPHLEHYMARSLALPVPI